MSRLHSCLHLWKQQQKDENIKNSDALLTTVYTRSLCVYLFNVFLVPVALSTITTLDLLFGQYICFQNTSKSKCFFNEIILPSL